MPRPSLTSAVAALWHSLTLWAKLHANRKQLRDDSRYRVELRITGTIAGYPVDETLNAWLLVGSPSTQASSTSVPTAELVATLLRAVPSTRRVELQDQIEAWWSESQALPELEKAELEQAKLWLKRLRATVPKEREGPVSLDVDADDEDLQAAQRRFAA